MRNKKIRECFWVVHARVCVCVYGTERGRDRVCVPTHTHTHTRTHRNTTTQKDSRADTDIHTYTHNLSLSLALSHTLSVFLSLSLSASLFPLHCLFLSLSPSLYHSFAHSLACSLLLSLTSTHGQNLKQTNTNIHLRARISMQCRPTHLGLILQQLNSAALRNVGWFSGSAKRLRRSQGSGLINPRIRTFVEKRFHGLFSKKKPSKSGGVPSFPRRDSFWQ